MSSKSQRENKYIMADLQKRIYSHVKAEQKLNSFDSQKEFNDKMRNQGKLLFESGTLLEDATSEQLSCNSFVLGYIDAKERSIELYDMGFQSFIDGIPYKDICENYQNNKYFMQGYREAKEQSSIDNIDWSSVPDDYDIEMFKKGKQWYVDGMSIDEAPEIMKYNYYFIRGFEKENTDYDLGIQNFIQGVSLKDYSSQHIISRSFLQGYIDAREQSFIDGINYNSFNDNIHGKSRK